MSRALHNTFLAGRVIIGPLEASIKRCNAEFQSQSVVDAAIELHRQGLREDQIAAIRLDVAKGAYNVLVRGDYRPQDECHNKEQADHKLKCLVAAALLYGDIWPEQFATQRMNRVDMQPLLKKARVHSSLRYTHRIPAEMPVTLTVMLSDGRELKMKLDSYEWFPRRLRNEIITAVWHLETLQVADLTSLLSFETNRDRPV